MARQRMVTRTIHATDCKALVVNTESATTETKNFEISGSFKTKDALLKAVKKIYDSENEKVVAISEYSEVSKLYGMTEQEFINLAKVLPDRA